jgi:carboxypeptidase Q
MNLSAPHFRERTPPVLRIVTLCAFVLISVVFAAAPVVPRDPTADPAFRTDDALISAALKESSLVPNLHYLSDQIGPRLTGSAALNKACAWAADRMRDYGLENVTMEPWTIPEGWERGECRARLVEPDNGVRLNLASYGWRKGTDGKVVCDVIALPKMNLEEPQQSLKELQALRGKLKGAIVLSGPPSKMRSIEDFNKPFGQYFGGGGKKGAPPKRPNYEEMKAFAKERDALLTKEGVAALFLDSGKPFGLTNTTGGWGGKERASATNKLPTLALAHDSYSMLYRLATRGGTAKTRLELEVSNKFIPGPIKVFNVYGEIKGSEKPDEVVVIGAHIDSWDLGQGTTDNGTGTCIVLEAARMIMRTGVKPKRTIRFCLFSGEEQGLFGSRYHVEKHKDDMAKVSAALMHDVGTGKVNGLGIGNRPQVLALLEKELAALKPLGLVDFKTPSGGGSDHQSFQGKGVPAFLMVQDPAYYMVSHHTAADTPARILEKDLVQGATVMAVSAVRIANLPELLPREATGKGKGKRGED